MKAQGRRSQMVLVQLLRFLPVPGVHGLLSVRSPIQARSDPMFFSTSLFSEAIISSTTETETKNGPSETPPSDSSTRKRLGKSSFLYKQRIDDGVGSTKATTATSAEDLRQMAEQHAGKTIGSSQYKKAWTRWVYMAVESIQKDLGKRLLLADQTDEDVRESFEKLFFDLGVAADVGAMPSFESEAARKGYALEFFCRGRALAEFLLETSSNADLENSDGGDDTYPGFWTRSLRSPECPILAASTSMSETPKPSTYEIVSLGGGPGFDFVGVALAAAFSFHTTASSGSNGTIPSADIHVTTMDYEEGWSDLVSAMDRSTRNLLTPSTNETSLSKLPAMSCDWGGKCDITKSILHEPVNANCKKLLQVDDQGVASRLWICQYCVAENAKALRDSDYVFLKELVREMPVGTLVLLTEVVPRLWPEMVRMLHREELLPFVDVGFRKGYNGKQFMLGKRGVRRPTKDITSEHNPLEDRDPFESLDERSRDQLEHFERLASYHERKVDSGWKRQGRKANGSTYHEEKLRHRRSRPEQE